MPSPLKDELATLAQHATAGIVTVSAAAAAWRKPKSAASRRLSALSDSGWIRRLRRGIYSIAPIDADSTTAAAYEDPWTLAATLFAPCYIGGWSAAEHWGLTEQLFRSTFVVTAAHVRAANVMLGGLSFRLARVSKKRATADATVWRTAARVPCSSPELTLVDGANSPSWVGGIRHLAEMTQRYVERPKRDLDLLARTMSSRGRGAGAKRLGFIAESLAKEERDGSVRSSLELIAQMGLNLRSTGVIKLDPGVRRRGKMNTSWGLWINVEVAPREFA
jgi:predicted transcriptional regulator of viral defense system